MVQLFPGTTRLLPDPRELAAAKDVLKRKQKAAYSQKRKLSREANKARDANKNANSKAKAKANVLPTDDKNVEQKWISASMEGVVADTVDITPPPPQPLPSDPLGMLKRVMAAAGADLQAVLGTEVGSPKEVDAAGYIPVRPAYTRLIQN
jgi:CRISPR/Cas system-associated exonuclease Cas4 (RecB family)